MKALHRVGVVLLYTTLLCSHPVLAQFQQQGPKLVAAPVGFGNQGFSVSLSGNGNTAIVGGSGGAWIWTRSGGIWTQQSTKLVGSGAVGNAGQGASVSISADGNTAIVGGDTDNNSVGAAWIWIRSGGVWTQQGAKLTGSDASGNAHQGTSVSLSADGSTAIVGGPSDNGAVGAAWTWTRSGGIWTQQGAKLAGSGAVGAARQGCAVSLASDGNTAIVGGYGDNSFTGASWVWTRSGGVWTQQGPKLVASDAAGNASQGYSTSVSADGNTAIAGAPNAAVGAAWVWIRSGGVWSQQGTKLVGSGGVGFSSQGHSVSISADGNTAAVGGNGDNPHVVGINGSGETGATWLWIRSAGVWTQLGAKLVGSDGADAAQGASVSLSGDSNTLIVGGPNDNTVGAAWVFINASAIPVSELLTSVILVLALVTLALSRLR